MNLMTRFTAKYFDTSIKEGPKLRTDLTPRIRIRDQQQHRICPRPPPYRQKKTPLNSQNTRKCEMLADVTRGRRPLKVRRHMIENVI